MAKELYLYSPIYDFVAEDLISKMEENKMEDLVIRGNTPGGSVFSGWGIIAKMKEHEGKVLMKVDGSVASMGTFILVFAPDSEALDVSKILLHRADMYINTPEDQAFLDNVNKDLKAKLIQKIDAVKLKELKGITIDDLFDPTKRLDVWLTAKEAKAVGLINRIVKLNPSEISAFNDYFKIAAQHKPEDHKPQPTNTVMNVEEIKTKHPEVYAQIMADGKKSGTKEEQDRVRGWEAFRTIDAEAVDKGIKSGNVITATDIAEFTAKALNPEAIKKIVASNAGVVTTEEAVEEPAEKTEKAKAISSFETEVKARFGLK